MTLERLKNWLPRARKWSFILILLLLGIFGVFILSNPNESIFNIDTWMRDIVWVAIGAGLVVLAACLLFDKSKLDIGVIRPQVLIVLLALTVITLFALDSSSETNQNVQNIAALAVGGMIALASRIIGKDSDDDNKRDDKESKGTTSNSDEDDPE